MATRLFPLGLAACSTAAEPPQSYMCLLPAEKRMLVAELFFGRDIAGRAPLSEAEWRDFAAEIITPNFPDGFTVFDAEGQWRNPATGADHAPADQGAARRRAAHPRPRGRGCRP